MTKMKKNRWDQNPSIFLGSKDTEPSSTNSASIRHMETEGKITEVYSKGKYSGSKNCLDVFAFLTNHRFVG